jgi:hypothetical protein
MIFKNLVPRNYINCLIASKVFNICDYSSAFINNINRCFGYCLKNNLEHESEWYAQKLKNTSYEYLIQKFHNSLKNGEEVEHEWYAQLLTNNCTGGYDITYNDRSYTHYIRFKQTGNLDFDLSTFCVKIVKLPGLSKNRAIFHFCNPGSLLIQSGWIYSNNINPFSIIRENKIKYSAWDNNFMVLINLLKKICITFLSKNVMPSIKFHANCILFESSGPDQKIIESMDEIKQTVIKCSSARFILQLHNDEGVFKIMQVETKPRLTENNIAEKIKKFSFLLYGSDDTSSYSSNESFSSD